MKYSWLEIETDYLLNKVIMDVRYDKVNEEVKVMELRKSQTREKIEVNTEMPRGQNKADFRRNKTSLLLQISMFFIYIFFILCRYVYFVFVFISVRRARIVWPTFISFFHFLVLCWFNAFGIFTLFGSL